jgi:hypothetical protein
VKASVLKEIASSTSFILGKVSIPEIAKNEVMLKRLAPEIDKIIDAMDHASLKQPPCPCEEVTL